MTKRVKLMLIMLGGASMTTGALAATPITITQSTTAAQSDTIVNQTRGTIGSTSPVGAGSTNFPGTASVAGTTAATINRFDLNTGILVGARYNVTMPYTVSLTALATAPASGSGRKTDVFSAVTGSVGLGGTFLTIASLGTVGVPATASCGAGNCFNLTGNNTTSTNSNSGTQQNFSGSATVANLANVAGIGAGSLSFATNVSAQNTTVTTEGNVWSGTAASRLQLGSTTAASNQYSVSYDYLNFANPSFATSSTVTSSSLNFGTRALGSGSVALNFAITNIGNINTAGLSLTSISRSTNNGQFSTNISTFTNGLDGGFTNNYTMNFDPLSVGSVNDIFTFTFIDFAPAGSVGGRTYTLTMNVAGDVFDPVPEPGSWMMMLLGFGLVGAVARRRAVSQPG